MPIKSFKNWLSEVFNIQFPLTLAELQTLSASENVHNN